MTLDRPFDDGADDPADDDAAADRRPQQQRGTGADSAGARDAGRAEMRTRAEYYEALYKEALRAADGGSAWPAGDRGPADGGADHRAGSEPERSGWNGVDAGDRPPADRISVSPERTAHILDGEATGNGGGHRHGTGRPGKTEFPAGWDDQRVIDTVVDVARRPDMPPMRQEWNGRWVARGVRDDVEIAVVIAGDGRIWTAWPLPGGAGVVKNPEEA